MMNYEDYLTPAEQNKCRAFAASIHWGFNRDNLEKQIVKFEKGDDKVKAEVLCVLEDCNYHSLYRILCEEGGDAARKWADENMYVD